MNENQIARESVDAAYKVHKRLGPGLLINFGSVLIRHNGISRVVNGLED